MDKRYFSIGALSDRGYLKKTNQDNILIKIGEDDYGEFGLFAIADGMGGLSDGQVASNMVVDILDDWWKEELPMLLDYSQEYLLNIRQSLNGAINKANDKVLEYGARKGDRLGTTLSLVFIIQDNYIITHIGDSRIYSLGKKIQMLTKDHSWVAEQVESGKMSLEKAERHKNRNALIKCIGVFNTIEPYQHMGKISRGERFILCSDGLYKLVDDHTIYSVINKHLDANTTNMQSPIMELFKLVKEKGAIDNVSIILVSQNRNKVRFPRIKKMIKKLLVRRKN